MGLFLKAIRKRSEPHLFQLRGLCATLGEDPAGLLTASSAAEPFFSIYCADNHYFLVPHIQKICLSEEPLETGVAVPLDDGTLFSAQDWGFQCVVTSALSEALARTAVTLSEITRPDLQLERLPLAAFTLAGTGKTYPLFPDVRYIAGSSRCSTIHLPLEGIAPSHCSLQFNGGSISVKPLDGEIALNGRTSGLECRISETSAVSLLPTGVEIILRFPAD